jgi:hypothetical protein
LLKLIKLCSRERLILSLAFEKPCLSERNKDSGKRCYYYKKISEPSKIFVKFAFGQQTKKIAGISVIINPHSPTVIKIKLVVAYMIGDRSQAACRRVWEKIPEERAPEIVFQTKG